MSDLDSALDRDRLGQTKFEFHHVSDGGGQASAWLKPLFREVEHLAWRDLGSSSNLPGPFDGDSEEFTFLGHVVTDLSFF